tara:strand:+ start:2064 stop:2510 length:447 start_codon:yes stop_codon:yes gene_type:complete
MKKKYLSQESVENYIHIIYSNIVESKWKPDIILSINRGGCIPGVYLSHYNSVAHKVLDFKDIDNTTIDLYKRILGDHKNILVVDDINDTGETLSTISKYFNEYFPKIKYAVIIENKKSEFNVDFYGTQIDKSIDSSWIVFPWENIKNE